MADSKYANDIHDYPLEDASKHLQFSLSSYEVNKLRCLVREYVENIKEVAGLPEKKVILVGSMAEGTRIIKPNEFDFMIELGKLSVNDIHVTWHDPDFEETQNSVSLKPRCRLMNCDGGENCAHVKNLTLDDFITIPNSESALLYEQRKAFKLIEKAVYKMAEGNLRWVSNFFTGGLKFVSLRQHGPAISIDLLWERGQPEAMEISIDLVPVLELEIDTVFLTHLGTCIFHERYHRRLAERKKVHLVQRRSIGLDKFQVSFALIEMESIRDESETHRKCYMLLKYYYQHRTLLHRLVVTSYVLKNLVLQHSVKCKCEKLGWCLTKIVDDLKHWLEASQLPFIPNTFNTKYNLLEKCNSVNRLIMYKELFGLLYNLVIDRSLTPRSFGQSLLINNEYCPYPTLLSQHPGPFYTYIPPTRILCPSGRYPVLFCYPGTFFTSPPPTLFPCADRMFFYHPGPFFTCMPPTVITNVTEPYPEPLFHYGPLFTCTPPTLIPCAPEPWETGILWIRNNVVTC